MQQTLAMEDPYHNILQQILSFIFVWLLTS